jgi:hypothetical protein
MTPHKAVAHHRAAAGSEGLALALLPGVALPHSIAATARTVIALAFVLIAVSEARANAILNPGFEEAGLSGWLVDPATHGSLIFQAGGGHSSPTAAWFGAVGLIPDTISQTYTTTPGQSYTLSFWLAHAASNAANAFTVWWDGAPVLSLLNAGRFGYHEYTFVSTALDTSSTIVFSGRETFSYFRLDDVSVDLVPNPEPATLVLFGSGIAALLVRARTRRASKR